MFKETHFLSFFVPITDLAFTEIFFFVFFVASGQGFGRCCKL